jgi:hypothetical protein
MDHSRATNPLTISAPISCEPVGEPDTFRWAKISANAETGIGSGEIGMNRDLRLLRFADVKNREHCQVDIFSAITMRQKCNGEGEIRTPATLSGRPVFETGAFNHSATSPGVGVQATGFIAIGQRAWIVAV